MSGFHFAETIWQDEGMAWPCTFHSNNLAKPTKSWFSNRLSLFFFRPALLSAAVSILHFYRTASSAIWPSVPLVSIPCYSPKALSQLHRDTTTAVTRVQKTKNRNETKCCLWPMTESRIWRKIQHELLVRLFFKERQTPLDTFTYP